MCRFQQFSSLQRCVSRQWSSIEDEELIQALCCGNKLSDRYQGQYTESFLCYEKSVSLFVTSTFLAVH